MSVPSSGSIAIPAASASTSHGNSMQHEAAIRVAMPDKVSATDYKFSLVRAVVSLRADTALVKEFARFIKIRNNMSNH
jgi:hypothetical protein